MKFLIYASGDLNERTIIPSTSEQLIRSCVERGHVCVHSFEVNILDETKVTVGGSTANLFVALPTGTTEYLEWHFAKRIAEAFWDGYDRGYGQASDRSSEEIL